MDSIFRILNKISIIWYQRIGKYKFAHFGNGVLIMRPLRIDGIHNIALQNNVHIHYKTWIAALPLTGESCSLSIGEGTVIGNFNHIFATKKITIGKKVLIADKVYISDNLHEYENIELPVMNQPIRQIAEVQIGDGSWIGENVVILGATIGKNCVIGANSVVTKNIPDFSVVVGVPAKIIKRYNFSKNKWLKTNDNGEFITS